MKAKELRIGNIIQSKAFMFNPPEWNQWTVTAEDLCHMEENDPDNYKGIPLTEEWLLKFGFDVHELNAIEDGDTSFTIHLNDGDFMKVTVYGDGRAKSYACLPGILVVPCAYVHQLQNLYFALTGEELTIKQ